MRAVIFYASHQKLWGSALSIGYDFLYNALNRFRSHIFSFVRSQLKNLSSFSISSGTCEYHSSIISEKCAILCFISSVYFSILPNCVDGESGYLVFIIFDLLDKQIKIFNASPVLNDSSA